MINQTLFTKYAANPAAFRDDLLVDVDGVVRRFGDVLDPFQKSDFQALDSGLQRAIGRGADENAKTRAWLERPRGHSKTTDLAVTCCYALAFATRPLKGYCYAADRDQAKLLKDAIATIVRLNPWLGKILSVEAHRVIVVANSHPGAGGTLNIEASDVGSSFGILPDLIIADEVCHWQGDGSLWHSLLSSAAKRASCLLVAITNAGFIDSWQWEIREAARADDSWHFSSLDGPQASWITQPRLAEQERMLPRIAFERLWLNRWSAGGGDALSQEDILAAFDDSLRPMRLRDPAFEYVAGIDLGVSRDASALCVLGVHRNVQQSPWHDKNQSGHGSIRLALTRVWRPIKGQKINLQDVEDSLAAIHNTFKLQLVAVDPWQAEHLSQRLALRRLPMHLLHPTGSNLQRMATAVLESFNDRRLKLYGDPDLKRDLQRLRVEERSYGFRLISPHDSRGHGDLASAFSLALVAAQEVAGKFKRVIGAAGGDASPGASTIEEKIARRAEKSRAAYEREMDQLAAWDDATERRWQVQNAMYQEFGDSYASRLRGGRFD